MSIEMIEITKPLDFSRSLSLIPSFSSRFGFSMLFSLSVDVLFFFFFFVHFNARSRQVWCAMHSASSVVLMIYWVGVGAEAM